MRKLLGALLGLLAFSGFAGSYFAGVEIIPHTFGSATYGVPYVVIGYDSEVQIGGLTKWAFAEIGLSSPLTINGWYLVKAGGKHDLTENLFVTGHVSVWGQIQNFAFTSGAWAVGAGIQYKFDESLFFFLNFHIPPQVSPATPFWGMWTSLGFAFYFGGN